MLASVKDEIASLEAAERGARRGSRSRRRARFAAAQNVPDTPTESSLFSATP